jgi:hypothetical protein
MIYLLDHKIPKYLDVVSERLYQDYLQEYGNKSFKLTDNKRLKIKQAINCFCYNAVYHLSFGSVVFPITLDEAVYSKPLIYNCTKINRKVSYTYTRSVLDWMVSTGRVVIDLGGVVDWYLDEGGVFKPKSVSTSTVELSEYLIEVLRPVVDRKLLPIARSVVEVRDDNGVVISKRLGDYERGVVKSLNTYNTLAREVEIEANGRVIDVQLKKVFNNSSFEQGGRNYMTGTGVLTKECRKTILIDGEETTELDFKSLHPRIAATLDGVELDKYFDPYQISIEQMSPEAARYFGKWAVLILLNSSADITVDGLFSFNSARKALISKLRTRGEVDFDNRVLTLKGVEHPLPEYIDYTEIIRACLERNDYIRLWFYESKGLTLQNYDSKIMDLIIGRFNEMDEIILPVHDSIVVKKRLKLVAESIMTGCFKQVLGSEHNCVII